MVDSISRLEGARTTFGAKKPVVAATTANITLEGVQTIDGVAVVADDRVLVKDQTDTAENGIYDVASGAWARSVDFDGTTDWCKGTLIVAAAGTVNGGKIYRVTSANPVDIDTDAITFESISFADPHANASIVGSATLNLDAVDADEIAVTGSGATVTAITLAEGRTRILRFTEAGNVITHSSSLGIPGAQNITTIANDRMFVRGYAGGVVRLITYFRGDSYPLITGEYTTLASASTTDLGSVREQAITITGATPITSFGSTAPVGTIKFVRLGGAILLTHDSSFIQCPNSQSIQGATGDTFIARKGSGAIWQIFNYTRFSEPHIDAASVSNASTSESDLMTFSLPAGRLASSGAGIRIKAWGTGTTVSTGATRRVRVYFGATVVADTGAINVPILWQMEATVLRGAVAGQQPGHSHVLYSTGGVDTSLQNHTLATETLSGAVTVKVTGLCTASTGVLTQSGFIIEQLSV